MLKNLCEFMAFRFVFSNSAAMRREWFPGAAQWLTMNINDIKTICLWSNRMKGTRRGVPAMLGGTWNRVRTNCLPIEAFRPYNLYIELKLLFPNLEYRQYSRTGMSVWDSRSSERGPSMLVCVWGLLGGNLRLEQVYGWFRFFIECRLKRWKRHWALV